MDSYVHPYYNHDEMNVDFDTLQTYVQNMVTQTRVSKYINSSFILITDVYTSCALIASHLVLSSLLHAIPPLVDDPNTQHFKTTCINSSHMYVRAPVPTAITDFKLFTHISFQSCEYWKHDVIRKGIFLWISFILS